MIDLTKTVLDADRIAIVIREARHHRPPLAVLVTTEQLAALAVDGDYLDGDIPVTTDPAVVPPAKPRPPPPLPPLADVKSARKSDLRVEVEDHISLFFDAKSREVLQALLIKAMLQSRPDVIAMIAPALEWCEVVWSAWYPLAAAVDTAETHDAVAAVVFDGAKVPAAPDVDADVARKALAGEG